MKFSMLQDKAINKVPHSTEQFNVHYHNNHERNESGGNHKKDKRDRKREKDRDRERRDKRDSLPSSKPSPGNKRKLEEGECEPDPSDNKRYVMLFIIFYLIFILISF